MVDIRAFTRADAPTKSPEDSFLLAGVRRTPGGRRQRTPRPHSEREERALRLSRAVARLLDQNPSMVRRATRHLDRLLAEDQGAASHDLSEWKAILTSYSPERLKDFLVATSSRADRLRQSSPFFAVLSAEERDRVLAYLDTSE